jgi:hypothetical protein
MTPPQYRGLALLYLFWTIALCSRAIWQYMTRDGNLIPTHLSLIAGIIYAAIVVWAWRGQRTPLIIGLIAEIAGVFLVSGVEFLWPLPYASAWSHGGAGYLYMPLLLPVIGLAHLLRHPVQQLDNQ